MTPNKLCLASAQHTPQRAIALNKMMVKRSTCVQSGQRNKQTGQYKMHCTCRILKVFNARYKRRNNKPIK